MGFIETWGNVPITITNSDSWFGVLLSAPPESNQGFRGKLWFLARNEDGVTAYWEKIMVVERTSGGNLRSLLIDDIISPILDSGAVTGGWDVNLNISGSTYLIEFKGGTSSKPVYWYYGGEIVGVAYP